MTELALQLSLMLIESAFAAAVLLLLFRARHILGLASLYTADGTETDELMRVADERLYRGKNEGRDRIVAD